VFFEVAAVVAGHRQAPVAEAATRVAVAAGPEQRRHRVTAGIALGVGDALQRLVDGRVERLGLTAQGSFEGPADGAGDRVVRDSRC